MKSRVRFFSSILLDAFLLAGCFGTGTSFAAEPASVPQGIYEIISAADHNYLLDVKTCTWSGRDTDATDTGELQTFRSFDVNQQKFYIENVPEQYKRISVLHTGDALTASVNNLAVKAAPMLHEAVTDVASSQEWMFEKAGGDRYYIRSYRGHYLTLASEDAYNGTPVVLRRFTGDENQQWILNNSWISSVDTEDTDFVNPYEKDGSSGTLDLVFEFGSRTDHLTAEQFAEHTSDNGSHKYVLDSSFIDSFVQQLAQNYASMGKDSIFTGTEGSDVTISQSSAGWKLDTEAIKAQILALKDSRGTIPVELIWAEEGLPLEQTYVNDTIGDSYVEVDMTHQKVWLYVDGKQILETDCVSGTYQDAGRRTPPGVFSLTFKQSPAVLRGADYESPVTYWMPFNGNIGLHDANWRSEFGGEIYQTNGSHGCINLPTESARIIYENIEKGFPVVCYYH